MFNLFGEFEICFDFLICFVLGGIIFGDFDCCLFWGIIFFVDFFVIWFDL